VSRRTLRRPVAMTGVGLFSGRVCRLRIGRGQPDSGWRWRVGGSWHQLGPHHLAPLPRRSRLVQAAEVLLLPEHVLAALVMADVDDVELDVQGGEVPLLDGSALPFARGLMLAGLDAPPSALRVEVTWRGSTVSWSGGFGPARARTFIDGTAARAARTAGLFPGARPDSALVLDGDARLLGGRGRRLVHEPAWHKLLDLLGDLGPYRAQGRLRGRLVAHEPSHDRNVPLIEAALSRGTLRRAEERAA
jgi:UDP-3-O-[3-hydroxymyristoyl] N-acetylglucosamine deacetylase